MTLLQENPGMFERSGVKEIFSSFIFNGYIYVLNQLKYHLASVSLLSDSKSAHYYPVKSA